MIIPSLLLLLHLSCLADAFQTPPILSSSPLSFLTPYQKNQFRQPNLLHSTSNNEEEEAAKLRKKADELKEEVRRLEERLGRSKPEPKNDGSTTPDVVPDEMSLDNKTVLVIGANGRVGSMICRYLLRNFPKTQVVAAVHVVSENSPTSRGYARLSYEVGAEDGVGTIGPAWSSSDERTATFEYADYMKDYNLQNLRIVEVELLDPNQCQTITKDVDCVVYAATDFNGNKPRAVSGLNVAFLFRAVADPMKGRVEIEGLRNVLGGLKNAKQSKTWTSTISGDDTRQRSVSKDDDAKTKKEPISFVLLSTAKDAFPDFETPFGSFKGIKREGEQIVQEEFPSLSHCILQMSRYEDNFVGEDLDICMESGEEEEEEETMEEDNSRRRINRRDAARAAANALIDENLIGKKVEVWTATR